MVFWISEKVPGLCGGNAIRNSERNCQLAAESLKDFRLTRENWQVFVKSHLQLNRFLGESSS